MVSHLHCNASSELDDLHHHVQPSGAMRVPRVPMLETEHIDSMTTSDVVDVDSSKVNKVVYGNLWHLVEHILFPCALFSLFNVTLEGYLSY